MNPTATCPLKHCPASWISPQNTQMGNEWRVFPWWKLMSLVVCAASWGLQHHWRWRRASSLPHGLRVPHHQPWKPCCRHPEPGTVHQATRQLWYGKNNAESSVFLPGRFSTLPGAVVRHDWMMWWKSNSSSIFILAPLCLQTDAAWGTNTSRTTRTT